MRKFTADDAQRAAQLKSLYNAKKAELGLSQVSIAEELGLTQGAISHMLNGHMAMTTDNILAWAAILEVHPSEIDPSLKKLQLLFTKLKTTRKRIAVIKTLSRKNKPSVGYVDIEANDSTSASLYGIEVDSDILAPFADQGDVLVVDPFGVIKKQTKIVVRMFEEIAVGRYLGIDRGLLSFERLDTSVVETHSLDDVISYSKIISVTTP